MSVSSPSQSGAAAVEFALVVLVFFMLLLGVAEFGRWLFALNAASEATRLGARVAVVCDQDDPAIGNRMRTIFPSLTDQQIDVEYFAVNPADQSAWVGGCSFATCAGVRVRLNGATVPSIAPFTRLLYPQGLPIPPFATTLTRESLSSTLAGSANPVCQ